MILRISLITICLFFVWDIAFSQTHFFTLTGQEIDLPTHSFNVTKVIDERVDKANIGWTQKGMANIKVNAGFADSFENEIINFINHNLGANGPNIQLIIRKLKISEKTGLSKETGFCELAIDFLLEEESQKFMVLQTSVTTEVTGMDVTKKHPHNIASAFKLSFEKLALVDLSGTENFLALPSDGSFTQISDSLKYSFPVFLQEIKTGIYADYEELKNNSPSNTEDFYIEKKERKVNPWNGTFEVIPKFQESAQKVKKVWAIALDGQVYVYHQKEFFPLTIEKYKLYFYGYGVPDYQSISTGAMIGGLIGAGITSGIENSNAKKQKVKYYLNPGTGGFEEIILEKEAK
ncbi:hypothetical protein J2X69_002398 [Algoriphagus sp. 4150]|uniref:DUF6563 family protein n=1 Tax=Algoriphagus sp. 4150 TaxID=2817756 RepID=UPI002864F0F3|nr:hypothetical protein [Algoriphagus sp. 4150]MDR7130051.1 hypothetical protein [Algoriphagus sp. 4150]